MRGFFRSAGQALAGLYPKGISLFWLAPAVPALVVVPEFVQHVVEVRLGMFDSVDMFRQHQLDPTRMAFGYVKVAGLFLAILAAARFWSVRGSDVRWWDLRRVAWGRFALGFVIVFVIGSLPELIPERMQTVPLQVAAALWMIATLPGLFVMLSGLAGDRATPTKAMWTSAWPWIALTALLVVLGFGPAAWLHQLNHQWASGAGPALLWALMIGDSLLVGLLAALVGTGLALGYRAFREAQADKRS